MPALDRDTSALLVVDFQTRLMPAIEDSAAVVANARRLLDATELLGVPALFTEQNPRGLGPTMPELRSQTAILFHKMTFDACRMPGFLEALPVRRDMFAFCRRRWACSPPGGGFARRATRSVRAWPKTRRPLSAASSATAPRSSPLRWCCSSGCAPPRTRACAASSTSSVSRVDTDRTATRAAVEDQRDCETRWSLGLGCSRTYPTPGQKDTGRWWSRACWFVP